MRELNSNKFLALHLIRAPFLKKRLLSRVFDGVEVLFGGCSLATSWCWGARERRWPIGWDRQRVGGAVKAGPSGPPVGDALRAPWFSCSPATLELDRLSGGLGCRGWWAQRTSPVRSFELGDRSSASGHSFALVRMVCSGHSQTGSFNSSATPPGWGPRRSPSSRLGCVRAGSGCLPGHASDFAIA